MHRTTTHQETTPAPRPARRDGLDTRTSGRCAGPGCVQEQAMESPRFAFTGKSSRSDSPIHLAFSAQPPSGGLSYRSLCGCWIRTDGGRSALVTCKECARREAKASRAKTGADR